MIAGPNLNNARLAWAVCICILSASTSHASAPKPTAKFSNWPDIAYAGPTFDSFVRDSFRYVSAGNPARFYDSMEMGIESYFDEPWNSFINRQRGLLAVAKSPEAKRDARVAVCTEVHRMVKQLVPKFSLERGFEFAYMTTKGERQCFLQSILIAGVLQRCEIESGIVMVYRNPAGQPSNLGHCVVVVTLSHGEQVLVDASAPEPFIAQKGIFARYRDDYIFLRPIFENKVFITGYRREVLPAASLPVQQVLPADITFMRSMFEYYRGERVINGVLTKNPSESGIRKSIRQLQKSVKLCRENPLALYMLGLAIEKQGKSNQWKYFYRKAKELYSRSGWVPSNLDLALKRVKSDGS